MEKIVITPLFGMGDSLMTTPALQLLKQHKPDCQITSFVFNKSNYELLKNNPTIDSLWYYPIKVSRLFQGIYHILGNFTFKYSTCINFYPSNRISYNGFAFLTGSRNRIGHSYLHNNFRQCNWLKTYGLPEDPGLHCVEENVKLLRFFGISVQDSEIPPTRIYLNEEEIKDGKAFRASFHNARVLGIHAGTSTFKGHANRRWPKERFIQMINLFPDDHFLLFGVLDEIEINHRIRESVNNPDHVTVIENQTIRQVAAIIQYLDGFISNDSGLMHIAAAMNTPVVAILGPTNPVFIHPWQVRHEVVRLGLPCSPCFYYSPRPLRCALNNSYKCLAELDVEKVAQAVRKCFAR